MFASAGRLATIGGRRLFQAGTLKQSAGILLYVHGESGSSVLLVHPSGPYNRNAPFGIPKGEPDEGEELEGTARREVREETGIDVTGNMKSLGYIEYKKSRKRVHAWAAPLPVDAAPKCASWEIDKAQMFPLDAARKLIHPDQAIFLDRLAALLAEG
jgi:predicted NUDIX family NTP pyrophosphohydrolase